jgi:hypothetical protein
MSKGTAFLRLGSLGTGAVTAAALAVQTGLAAVVGVVIGREFGRGEETDGFFLAYGVFIVLVLAAAAIRVTVLPALARARLEERLAGELASYAVALASFAVPLVVLAVAAAAPVARLLTLGGPELEQDTAATALQWMVPAAVAQLFAGLLASGLAALDDYAASALGYTLGSAAGLALILWRVDEDGIVVVAWGMALNAGIALALPAAALALHARRRGAPRSAARPSGAPYRPRLAEIARGVSLPLAIQALYVVCLPLARREGTGEVTSFTYAYLIGAALIAVTASSLGLVTSVPLARAGLGAARAARHVVASSWLAVVCIGAAAGVFAVAGRQIVEQVLGAGYRGEVGSELGRLIVVMSPWMVVSVGVTVTFPLLFVERRARRLPLLAIAALLAQVPLAAAGQQLGGLEGLAVALTVTTTAVLAVLLAELGALATAVTGLLAAAAAVAAIAVAAFGLAEVVLDGAAAAAIGLVVYIGLVALVRPPGLRTSWRYLRELA